jgi:hypothetical protein
MKTQLLTVAVVAISAVCVQAGPSAPSDGKKAVVPVEELFRAGENQFDVFGVYGTGNVDKSSEQVNYTKTKTVTETKTKLVYNDNKIPDEVTTTETKEVKKRAHYRVNKYQHNTFGGGIGLNHFFTRNLGVGLEGYWMTEDTCIHTVAAQAIYRFPWENAEHNFGVAPYIFAGGGGQFDGISAAFGDVGAGAEFRFSRHCGIFADGRYVIHDNDIMYGLFRLGGRIVF